MPALPEALIKVKRLDRALELVVYYFSAALMLALTGVILYAVVARYFFNASPAWSDEVPRVIFLWITYLAIALAVRRGQSLRITFLLDKLPPGGRVLAEMLMHTAIFVMLAFLVWHNLPVIELGQQSKMLATQWSDATRFWPLTVGCVLLGIHQVRLVLRTIEDYRGHSAR